MTGPGYDVDIRALGTAAEGARGAAKSLTDLHLDAAVSGAGAGIPGADAATALGDVGRHWQGVVSAWTSAARAYADDLDASATTYRRSESQAEHDFAELAVPHAGAGRML